MKQKFANVPNNGKRLFNQDLTKQAQEVIFSRKSHSPNHSNLYFNSLLVEEVKTRKLKLDERLNFREYLKD